MSEPDVSLIPHRILVVDDQPAIHDDFAKVLAADSADFASQRLAVQIFGDQPVPLPGERYEVDAVTQGDEALKKVRQALIDGRPYAVAFVDIRMPPGWNGVQTIAALRETDPALQFVICTAYSDYSWAEIQRRLGPSDSLVILKKPFDKIEVQQLAHALCRKWALAQVADERIASLDAAVDIRTRELREANARLQAETAERLNIETALLQSQKMEAIGQLAAGIAHDFNNILTVVRGHATLLLERPELDPEIVESLHEVSQAAERATALASQLLTLSRKQPLKPSAFDVNETIGDLYSLLARVLGEKIELHIECDPNVPPLYADQPRIEQVLINLAVNARDAMPEGGELHIGTSTRRFRSQQLADHPDVAPGKFVTIRVADTGIGMTPEVQRHLFEPFFTTKEEGKGTGLGLATAYGIVKQHRGWIEVASEPGQGSEFRVYLPCAATLPLRDTPPAQSQGADLCGTERALVVEDEPTVRAVIRGILKRAGYTVTEATDAAAALAAWEANGRNFDVVISDLVMPGELGGHELAMRLRAEQPGIGVLLITGYIDKAIGEDEYAAVGIEVLRKPFTREDLLRAVRRAIKPAGPA
jgi:signal transduction histidine kinase